MAAWSSLQKKVHDAAQALLRGGKVSALRVKEKVQNFDDGEEDDDIELSISMSFSVGAKLYELWLYKDEVGWVEPGEEWLMFDSADYGSENELCAAVLKCLRDILE